MRAQARLMCAEGCAGEFTPATTLYRCPRCAGLLEVRHELAALPEAAVWREIVRTRTFGGEWPHLSGVWRLHEWVMPWVRREHVVSLGEGGSPLVPAGRYGAAIGARSLWIKQCGSGHTGSFKDLGMTVLVSAVKQIIAEGREIRAMVCASTGDTSAALAAYGAAAGIPVIVLLPAGKISSAQLLQPRAHGAMVVALEADFDGCMRVVERLAAEPTLYLANSLNCLRIEGQKTIAWEIVAQRGGVVPAWVLVPGGNLGNVSALAKGFLELLALGWIDRLPRLVCCQAERAAPLYEAFLRAKAAGRALRSEDYRPVQAGRACPSGRSRGSRCRCRSGGGGRSSARCRRASPATGRASRRRGGCEQDGEHLDREAHRLVDEARVEVDVRVELALDEVLVVERDLLELEGDVEERVLAGDGEDVVRELLDDLGARVVVLVDAVAEAHQAVALAALDAGDELGDVLDVADLPQHAEHGLVGAAVQRAVEGGGGGGEGAVRVVSAEPTARAALAEQFCSWSACRMKSTSRARSSTGCGLKRGSDMRNSMLRKLPQ
jgi:threonine synthase